MSNGRRRVVITGMGAVTPLGDSIDEYWASLVKGKSGIGPMTLADPTAFPCKIAGEIPDFDPGKYIDRREARRMARFSQTAVRRRRSQLRTRGSICRPRTGSAWAW